MEAFKCVSFWKFVPQKLSTERLTCIRKSLITSCKEADTLIKGRVYLSHEGINGQMAVPNRSLAKFQTLFSQFPEFREIKINVQNTNYVTDNPQPSTLRMGVDESKEYFPIVHLKEVPFENLSVCIKDSLISGDKIDELNLDLLDNIGEKLPAHKWHSEIIQYQNNKQNELVILDCRNFYEYDVGRFVGSIPLDTSKYSESFERLDQMKDELQQRRVLLYCTGGIRCVKIAAYLHQKLSIKNTGMLEGGIIAYSNFISSISGSNTHDDHNYNSDNQNHKKRVNKMDSNEENKSLRNEHKIISDGESLFRGTNFVFDERLTSEVTVDKLATCKRCAEQTNQKINCKNPCCSLLVSMCPNCQTSNGFCSVECETYETKNDKEKKWLRRETARLIKFLTDNDKSTNYYRNPTINVYALALQNFSLFYPTPPSTPSLSSSQSPSLSSLSSYTSHSKSPTTLHDHAAHNSKLLNDLEVYSSKHSSPLDLILQTIINKTSKEFPSQVHQICGPLVAQYLQFLIKLINAKNVLEIGCFTGYSAIAMASSLPPSGRLITCEVNLALVHFVQPTCF